MTTTDKNHADALTGPYSTRHRSIGDWLWCELTDYCKELGMPPADNDRLFAIVDLARAAWDRPVEQHEAAPASLEGLRRAVLTPRAFVRDEYGMLTHPAIPALDEDVNYHTFFAAFGIESTFVCMETDVDCDAYERYVESNDPNCSFWTPSTPAGDGWLLLEIYDTEDGPVALYVREKKPESMREREKQEHLATQPAPSAPLEGTGNGADAFAHELWAAAQLAPSEGISDGVQRIVAALSRAPRTEVAGAVLSGDASECLMAVVSHHRDFVNACKVMHFDAINDDSDAYWEKQIDVLNRMKAQAERALSEPSADAAAAPKAFTDTQIAALRVAAEALVERYAEPIRAILRHAEHAAAPADERAAFETWWVREVPEQFRADTLRLLRQSRELDGKYGMGNAEGAWEVWQACTASANEMGAE
ncbi:hypothetical protein [Burkholderia sp. FL-7-2-10-S1-D7]|uniref:hypothetical protein n=1 Tax=Burkholderia sp. FL-7-2-10-S1-D7 TaxID=1637866 RepID=UPI000B0024EE|nr:hypothetical protein [Burkholderia sp. FL-7-2-10-S1-D7]